MLGIITGIVGAVGSIVAAAGSVVKSLAVVGLAVDGLKKVGGVLVNLAKAFGLIKPQIQVDELGDKALQSGYDPEQYDNYTDYVKAVEEFDDLDAEKSKLIPEEDKIKKGMELATGIMLEKYKDCPMDRLCVEVGNRPDFFTEGILGEVGKLIDTDKNYISDIAGYLDGTEKDDNKLDKIIGTLSDIYKSGNPGISDDDAIDAVYKARK